MTQSGTYVFDPALCEVQPIHIPGHIQPFGALVATTRDLHIVYASANCEELLGHPPEALFRQPLNVLVGDAAAANVQQRFDSDSLLLPNSILLTVNVRGAAAAFETLIHYNSEFIILEFEPASVMQHTQDFYRQIQPHIERLREAADVQMLCEVAAQIVRELTGYDRVMVYRFNELDQHGAVLAEARAAYAESFLGLRYPATDIPRPARELFLINGIRMIVDAAYEPTPIIAVNADYPPLDLTQGVLRGVAAGHIQYLKNMGTAATCSIAIIKHNQLWGLFACHHMTPQYISPAVRDVLRFLGSIFSAQFSAIEDREHAQYEAYLLMQVNAMLHKLTSSSNLLSALHALLSDLKTEFNSAGVALVDRDNVSQFGVTPEPQQIRLLANWLHHERNPLLYASHHLSAEYAPGAAFAEVGSGVMALSLSHVDTIMLLWFRPEVVQQVTWGRQIEQFVDSPPLSPGSSFKHWQQIVKGHAVIWHEKEIRAAQELCFRLIDLRMQQIIAESELRRTVLDATLSIVFLYHPNAQPLNAISYINSFTAAWLGYDEQYLRERKLLELIPVSDLMRDQPSGHLRNFEHPLHTAAGEARWCYLNITPVFVDGQDALLVSALDITDRKHAAQQAMELEIERQHIQLLTDFIQNASHDFKTPLSVINTSLYLLRRAGHPEQQERLKMLEEQANFLDRLVENLLILAQLEQQGIETFHAMNLNDLVLSIYDGLVDGFVQRQQILLLNLAPDLPPIRGDEFELTRCIRHLLENAHIYTPDGGQIVLQTMADADFVFLKIMDNGIGILPEDLPYIFKSFYRSDKARMIKPESGSGLGLAIVKKIVEEHEGSITAASVVSEGSTFTVRLPRFLEVDSS